MFVVKYIHIQINNKVYRSIYWYESYCRLWDYKHKTVWHEYNTDASWYSATKSAIATEILFQNNDFVHDASVFITICLNDFFPKYVWY